MRHGQRRALADSPRRFTGVYLHIALCVGAALLMNGLIFGLGWGRGAATSRPWFAPPGHVVGAVWLGLFAAMAAARWHLATRAGAAAASARLSVDALIAYCLVWPLYA